MTINLHLSGDLMKEHSPTEVGQWLRQMLDAAGSLNLDAEPPVLHNVDHVSDMGKGVAHILERWRNFTSGEQMLRLNDLVARLTALGYTFEAAQGRGAQASRRSYLRVIRPSDGKNLGYLRTNSIKLVEGRHTEAAKDSAKVVPDSQYPRLLIVDDEDVETLLAVAQEFIARSEH